MLTEVHILIEVDSNEIRGVYDSDYLALKRKLYYENAFPEYTYKIINRRLERTELE